ncbi:nitroreductase family protein [Glaesserella sp.]|uniref:nitroreductase family protein n=1 Tax=Glaesserella sp. TaxID=2094731 RepID=UPI0035A02D91
MSLADLLHHRRSLRYYDPSKPIESEKVKYCLQLATLAPSSSNLQLYEFYHITEQNLLQQLARACLSQQPATTAQQMVVFVARQDLHKQRAQAVLAFERDNIQRNSPPEVRERRTRGKTLYYGKLLPFFYAHCFGLVGAFRKSIACVTHLFRPVMTDVSESDCRVMTHKSCALAAQTFMIAMAEQGYDTCPMEGFDSYHVRKILNLPRAAEITMVIACGIREEGRGIWGDRFRIPFEQVYKRL